MHASSPDNTVQLLFSIVDGQPRYAVTKNGSPVIESSAMGFEIAGQTDQHTRYKLISTERNSADEKWEQPWGEFRTIEDRHNALTVHLEADSGVLINIQFRVFDDGAGFRYSFPEQKGIDSVVINDELTQFTFPEDHQVWWIPVHSENSYYESLYRKNLISETDTINTPATFESADGLYLAIHDATRTYIASVRLR